MILPDSCTPLWLAIELERLSSAARRSVAAAAEFADVSAISAWEIAWKHRAGKLERGLRPEERLASFFATFLVTPPAGLRIRK